MRLKPSYSGAGITINLATGTGATWQAISSLVPDGNVTGTIGNDTINSTFVDAQGDMITDNGQIILGLDGNDNIFDGAGNDTVSGGAGNDKFYAGAGADSYDGGAGLVDEIRYFIGATTGVTVDMSNMANNTGVAVGDSIVNVERLHATNFDDVIVTGGDLHTVFGRAGNDDFTDDAGVDTFRGDAGADVFRFIAGDGAQDRIYDFELGIDRIDISAWGASSAADLTITEQVNGAGTPYLVIDYGTESLRLDALNAADIASFNDSQFIFV